MDRQEFSRLVFVKLATLNPHSITFTEETSDSMTIEIISNEFKGLSVLKRINKAFSLLSNEIQTVEFNVDFVTLTVNEKESDADEQSDDSQTLLRKPSGLAAQQNL